LGEISKSCALKSSQSPLIERIGIVGLADKALFMLFSDLF
jgi:hypothetical protein